MQKYTRRPLYQKRIFPANSLFMRSNYRRTSHRTLFACSLPLLLADSRYSALHNWPRRESQLSARNPVVPRFSLRRESPHDFPLRPSRLLHANRGTTRMPRYGSVARFYLDCASIAKYVDRTDRSISIHCGGRGCNSRPGTVDIELPTYRDRNNF